MRATTPLEVPNGNGSTGPTGQDVLADLVSSVGAELAGGLAGPLLYLAFLSNSTQAVPIEWREQLREQLRTFLCEWADTVERREHLRLLGWMAASVAASPLLSSLNTSEQERLAKVIAIPGRVGGRSIDHIETMLQECKRQEDAFGPHAVLHNVTAQRELVDFLLDECSDELRPRLLSVYSSMSSSMGIYFMNLEDPASAMHYCEEARAAAREAQGTELSIYALCMMSHFAFQQGKVHNALDFAAAAQNFGSQTDDHLLRACAAVEFAVAYAAAGQHMECMRDFDRAFTCLTVPASQGSPDSPVYWLHEGLVASHQSDCLLQLGRPTEAAATAERALLATKSHSARLTSEVRAARGWLRPWQDMSVVRELDERLRGLGFGG